MLTRKTNSKVVVVGAGNVGSATAYAIAQQQLCGELVIVDVAADKAEGEALDIAHGMPFVGGMKVYSAGYEACKDADVIVITAGAGRKPGETRLDLANKNANIIKAVTGEIMKHYNGALILVISNPVDVITTLILKWSGLPADRVVGSGTILDTSRLRYVLGRHFGVEVMSVQAYVLGEHGDSQFVSWHLSNIAGVGIDEYAKMTKVDLGDSVKAQIEEEVRLGGANVIKRKGATNFGIAACVASVTKSLLGNFNTVYSVGSMFSGQYGISDIVLSTPTIVGGSGVVRQLECPLPAQELEKMNYSAEQIKSFVDACL